MEIGKGKSEIGVEAAAAWETIAEGWAERVRTGSDWSRVYNLDPAHLALVGDVAGLRILDAGCGEGRFARMMAERGASVTGIDFSERMIELALAQEESEPLGIEYLQADMADLGTLQSNTFDLAVAYLSLVDVPDYQRGAAEVARVLKPGGRFLFSIPHPCFTTPGAEWVARLPGIVPVRDKDRLYRKVDNYFPASEVRFKMWPTAPAETVNYHRPLSDYAHACRNAGLVIRDLIEPTPDAELAERIDFFKGEFRAPTFIIFECVKEPVL
jgi:2-polyprenyl-3-methyl-5-hydroxy-6-metoxy-1,4-benzoquinol methylase